MAPSRLPRASTVLLTATLAVTATAIDFSGQNDIAQTAATVAPGGETSQGWSQPTTTDTPSVWTPISGQPSGTGDQGWSQQTGWTSTASSATGAPSIGESSGPDDGTLGVECSGSSDEGGVSDDQGMSLECSGSDEGVEGGDDDYSLECSGSDEEEPSTETSTAPTTTTAPSTSSGTGDQGQPSSTASSSDTATSAASGESGETSPSTSTTSSSDTATSGGTGETQTSSTASSSNTDSSSNTEQSPASSSNTAQPSMASSSNTESSATQGGSDATQTSTSTGEHATFGTVTSKSGACVIGNPNKYVTTKDIDWVYENRMGVNQTNNKNWIFDHIVKNKGTLNYCVRWDSTQKLSKTVASKFQAMLERQYAAWNRWLVGYGCWPYDEIKVNMVGFAVKDASLLDWTDDSLGTIYEGDLDAEGVPQCPQTCYRFYDNGPQTWTDTSGCKGEPFDLSLWPKQGLEGGFGYDWGQEVNLENMLQTIDKEQLTIVAHEIGHGFGLPDFYSEAEKPNPDWPSCIMMAGSSMTVTDSDGWMVRRAYEHIRSRYNFK
ncbi:neutral zinc metallopeptidase, Zn-binding site [Phytophthora sojae]|uniref:Neutral zinc metallopeptidase, Zn-binding site n=1 Tax=Phytophthora sojae (strain P6497) TaxID=1094619 RepID=G4ZQ77_PHYSP|nr:neutral zinc metallopeptidase, Zn-binding site [Phytophthora sojae]EGZ14788.1 neutral zinc metallopeptidase, Zn-binding site [Phytophthora sojae]|eukprot:XP_009528537.1 neutral zinc metallopeptidase, Zn-binding site [Phytophthora sojae]